jgi:hypothetical protein
MKNKSILISSLFFCHVLISNTCKKDYYTGTEKVRLSATLNDTSEVLHLGDTLKVKLVIPDIVVSESGQTVNVNSVQQGQYNFIFYQFDTLTQRATRIRNADAISVSKGTIDSYLSNVYVSTTGYPYESMLNIVPPVRGIYYLEIHDKGAFKANNTYGSFLKVNFNVQNIHNDIMTQYSSADVGNAMLESQTNGIGFYVFKVN